MSGTGSAPGQNAISLFNLLENAVTGKGSRYILLLTMPFRLYRGVCAFSGFTQLINSSKLPFPHMSRENYRAAIEGPIKYAGATIDPKLVETLLTDIGDQTDQLPVLQHALMRTWSYWQELDDPGRAISFQITMQLDHDRPMSRHANEAFEELSPREGDLRKKLSDNY